MRAMDHMHQQRAGLSLWGWTELYLSALYPQCKTPEHSAIVAFLTEHITTAATSPLLLSEKPSLLAAALIACARSQLHILPEWPQVRVSGGILVLYVHKFQPEIAITHLFNVQQYHSVFFNTPCNARFLPSIGTEVV